jgi:hypothetical protein
LRDIGIGVAHAMPVVWIVLPISDIDIVAIDVAVDVDVVAAPVETAAPVIAARDPTPERITGAKGKASRDHAVNGVSEICFRAVKLDTARCDTAGRY